MGRIKLIAKQGMMYTNGKVTGYEIHLAEGEEPNGYWQITEEEYFATIEQEM